MNEKKFNKIVLDAKSYSLNEYQTFKADQYQAFKDGRSWADWIDEYVDYEDDNEIIDHKAIEKVLTDAFAIAHDVKFTYHLFSEDMKPAFESKNFFGTIEELKKDVAKYGTVNYIIYAVDNCANFEEIEIIKNV